MKTQLPCLLIALFSVGLHAQNTLSGNLNGWEPASAEIITGMNAPIQIGAIAENGEFTIELTKDFVEKTLQGIDGFNENSDAWKSSLSTIEKAFACNSETVALENADQPILSVSNLGNYGLANIEDRKMYGSFMIVNNKDFAEGFRAFGKYENKKGYYLDWYYFEKAATVKGECSMESYALNQEESYIGKNIYDLNFKPGWNIVKYEVLELFEDRDGKTYEALVLWETLDEMPADVQYIYFAK
ncbi:hypothetical protein [Eudoraea sp.]|uniref:hypothetical protein n=1 Tax=Eudoraea sp. TaxID=1979955 RepID=UPI003C76AFEC